MANLIIDSEDIWAVRSALNSHIRICKEFLKTQVLSDAEQCLIDEKIVRMTRVLENLNKMWRES